MERRSVSSVSSVRGEAASNVAQVSNLLYRRLPAGRATETRSPPEWTRGCGLEIRDTAGWKPALRHGHPPLAAWSLSHRWHRLHRKEFPSVQSVQSVAQNECGARCRTGPDRLMRIAASVMTKFSPAFLIIVRPTSSKTLPPVNRKHRTMFAVNRQTMPRRRRTGHAAEPGVYLMASMRSRYTFTSLCEATKASICGQVRASQIANSRRRMFPCFQSLGIGQPGPQAHGVRDREAGWQGRNLRQVLVEQIPSHATGSREYRLPIKRAA